MEQIVHTVGPRHAGKALPRRTRTEGEESREIEIGHKTHHIAHGVGHAEGQPSHQEEIERIVQPRGESAHQGKADGFGQGVLRA